MQSGSKVLCVRLRSMGDAVLLTPALRALRRGWPSAEIHVALDPPLVPLLAGLPDIDAIHAVESGPISKVALARRLRGEGFDVVINFHGGPTSAWLAAATGAKLRVGRDIYRFRYAYNLLVPPPERVFSHLASVHTVHVQASLVAALGIDVGDLEPRLAISEGAKKAVRGRLDALGLPQEGYILFQPTASFVSKQWPVERFLELARELRKHTARKMLASLPDSPRQGRQGPSRLWGLFSRRGRGTDDHATSNTIESARRALEGELPVLAGLPLDELAALLEGASLYIGNDSGPMHVAAAVGTPVIGIFGSSDPRRWHPWSNAQRTISAGLECSPCHGKWCANPERHVCLKAIEPGTVLRACLALLERGSREEDSKR